MKKVVLIVLFAISFNLHAIIVINGAGASFPNPIYSKWFSEYNKKDSTTRFNYQAIGSGGGIMQFTQETVDFGASDAPMTKEEEGKTKWPVKHVATVLGAVAVAVNLGIPDVKLTMDAEVLAMIFRGEITKWNDLKLQKLNPNVKLPNIDILTIYRADGSGTTAIFTDYLSKANPQWKAQIGSGKSIKWPVGMGAKGNDGIAGMVQQIKGAIGYVELAYAVNNKLPYIALKNKSGESVFPTIDAITLAASGVKRIEQLKESITDSSVKGAYPISAFTYILIPVRKKTEKDQALAKFLTWALTDGQKFTKDLHYAPIPAALADQLIKEL